MAPKNNEKQIINEKVAQVRQVVDHAATNDIIMVLHTFDLDVNKTIQAFCEDGAASILGDWVTSSGVSVTDAKKKKNKKSKAKAVEEGAAVAATPVATAAAPSASSAASAPAPAQSKAAKAAAPAARQEPSSVTKPSTNAVAKPAVNGAPASNDPLSVAFKALRLALNDREKSLKQTLASNPKAALPLDTSSLIQLISSFGESAKPVSNGKPAAATKAVKTVSPPPAAAPIKHATSQSSLTSSVGADSGVNLSPTHKEEKKTVAAPQKAQTQTVVSNGGLQMTSETLSAAQLAALQQTLQLQLAARGLDASVLTSSENVSRRPRTNKNDKKEKNAGKNQKEQPKLSIL